MPSRTTRRVEARIHRRSRHVPTKSLAWKVVLAIVVLGLFGLTKLFPYWSPWAAAVSRLRTVIVIDEHKAVTLKEVVSRQCRPWLICQNGKDNIDVVVLKKGKIPSHPTKAIVETDSDCAADRYGNSHCINDLRLSDGHEIEVRHDHNMTIYPCLKPGETVEVEGEPST